MTRLGTTYRLVVALMVAMLLSLNMTEASASERVECGRGVVQQSDAAPCDDAASIIGQWRSSAPLLPSEISHLGHSVGSVRTVARTSRPSDTLVRMLMSLRSIDATTTTNRYGLYNHKILFVSHSRFYYLNCLSRLRI